MFLFLVFYSHFLFLLIILFGLMHDRSGNMHARTKLNFGQINDNAIRRERTEITKTNNIKILIFYFFKKNEK